MMKIFSIDSYSEFVLGADLHILGKILDSKLVVVTCKKLIVLFCKIFGFKSLVILN